MNQREGSLEAPRRHPIAWREDRYYDEGEVLAEMERVFGICHGCRRCVNLCNAFPTLFDLVDASRSMEIDGVEKKDYWKVVDQCYLCDICFMTKCPYVPPHEWNLDFPHLMLRAKAVKFRQGEVKFRDKLLTSTDARDLEITANGLEEAFLSLTSDDRTGDGTDAREGGLR